MTKKQYLERHEHKLEVARKNAAARAENPEVILVRVDTNFTGLWSVPYTSGVFKFRGKLQDFDKKLYGVDKTKIYSAATLVKALNKIEKENQIRSEDQRNNGYQASGYSTYQVWKPAFEKSNVATTQEFRLDDGIYRTKYQTPKSAF